MSNQKEPCRKNYYNLNNPECLRCKFEKKCIDRLMKDVYVGPNPNINALDEVIEIMGGEDV